MLSSRLVAVTVISTSESLSARVPVFTALCAIALVANAPAPKKDIPSVTYRVRKILPMRRILCVYHRRDRSRYKLGRSAVDRPQRGRLLRAIEHHDARLVRSGTLARLRIDRYCRHR